MFRVPLPETVSEVPQMGQLPDTENNDGCLLSGRVPQEDLDEVHL